jgi:hypothetical protein
MSSPEQVRRKTKGRGREDPKETPYEVSGTFAVIKKSPEEVGSKFKGRWSREDPEETSYKAKHKKTAEGHIILSKRQDGTSVVKPATGSENESRPRVPTGGALMTLTAVHEKTDSGGSSREDCCTREVQVSAARKSDVKYYLRTMIVKDPLSVGGLLLTGLVMFCAILHKTLAKDLSNSLFCPRREALLGVTVGYEDLFGKGTFDIGGTVESIKLRTSQAVDGHDEDRTLPKNRENKAWELKFSTPVLTARSGQHEAIPPEYELSD